MSLVQVDMRGAVSGEDDAGHRIAIRFDGNRVTLDTDNAGAALAVLSAIRYARATGTSAALGPITRLALSRIGNIEAEVRIRGLLVARGGNAANATWLGRALTGLPVEMYWIDLLHATLRH